MPAPSPLVRDPSAETAFTNAQSSQDMNAGNDHENKTKTSNTVDWAGEKDESNPLNWTMGKRWRNVAVVVLMTLNTPLASSMFAPAVPQAMKEFHSTSEFLSVFVVSIYVLGFAIGPLFTAPLSEIYGRQPTYLLSNLLFVIFSIACAVSSNLGMLVAFRFLAGCAGGTPTTIGGATIGDMFPKEKRGAAMAVWGMGVQLGPIVGPIIGGFLSQAEGWRWVFWLQSIFGAATLVLGALCLRETYAVVILAKKTRKIISETNDPTWTSALDDGIQSRERLIRAIVRPAKILMFSPVVLLLSIYTAITYGYLYLFVTTFPAVFQQQYGFTTSQTGLTYLGLGVGTLTGLVISGKTMDPLYRRLTAKNHGESKPEFRLPPLMFSSPLIGISFFFYGWSAEVKTHWIVPIIGTVFFGIGLISAFMSVTMYLVDTYTNYAASAIAASKVLQSVAGAFLPLAGKPLYSSLGLGWGNSVLGFMAFAFVPLPWLFFKYGENLRTGFPVDL